MTVKEYLNENKLWKASIDMDKFWELGKDTPIYITGIDGPQGKSALKHLLIGEGYTNVLEMDDVRWMEAEEKKERFGFLKDSDLKATLAKTERLIISNYKKTGVVFDFGNKLLETH